MHECLLCKRDMKTARYTFGNGCINKIFNLLEVKRPTRCKDKEEFLLKCIMEKNNILKLNKKKQLWLADRYLTREYLNKLHYADVADINKEIGRDIKNISKIKSYEELVTARKITLKEANDLYKDEEKFNENLEKLKNDEYKSNIELKLLISGFSFIFNIYRYKNQYERDAFKKMQYVFW